MASAVEQKVREIICEQLGVSEGDVTPEALAEAGLVRKNKPVKVLGNGEVSAALTVRVHKISAGARQKIEAAGGSIELIETGERHRPSRGRKRSA